MLLLKKPSRPKWVSFLPTSIIWYTVNKHLDGEKKSVKIWSDLDVLHPVLLLVVSEWLVCTLVRLYALSEIGKRLDGILVLVVRPG